MKVESVSGPRYAVETDRSGRPWVLFVEVRRGRRTFVEAQRCQTFQEARKRKVLLEAGATAVRS